MLTAGETAAAFVQSVVLDAELEPVWPLVLPETRRLWARNWLEDLYDSDDLDDREATLAEMADDFALDEPTHTGWRTFCREFLFTWRRDWSDFESWFRVVEPRVGDTLDEVFVVWIRGRVVAVAEGNFAEARTLAMRLVEGRWFVAAIATPVLGRQDPDSA